MADFVKVKDAEITEDGLIVLEFNESLNPTFNSKKVLFAPEVLIALAMKYGVIPPREETDFPGIPFVGGENVDLGPDSNEDEEDEDGDDSLDMTEEEEPKAPEEDPNGPTG